MEIVNKRRKLLNAMDSNTRENDNFTSKMISMENVERKCNKSEKEESNLFLFQVIDLGD